MWKYLVGVTVVVLLIGIIGAGCFATRAGYASAPYTVRSTDGPFEVRDYPALQVAITTTAADSSDNGFMRLFGYISGKNAGSEKISMTTPVLMFSDPTNQMAFVLPEAYTNKVVPQPSEGSVQVQKLPPTRFAVLRYSGGDKTTNRTEALNRLQAWLSQVKMKGEGSPVYAFFDPPWTPPFWRRNEVMVRLKPNLSEAR